jgi:hypothetical protein
VGSSPTEVNISFVFWSQDVDHTQAATERDIRKHVPNDLIVPSFILSQELDKGSSDSSWE